MKLLSLVLTPLLQLTAASTQDTWETGSLTPNATLVPHSTEMTALCLPRNVDIIPGRPIPTNTWWGNLITCDASSNAVQPIWPNPYALTVDVAGTDNYGLALAYPYRMRFFGDVTDGVARYYAHPVLKEVIFSATEFATTAPTFKVVSWTDLSVKLEMRVSPTTVLESNVLSGMTFFTTSYQNLTPRIVINNPIASINGVVYPTGTTLMGLKFLINTVNGNQWVLYAVGGSPVSLRIENDMLLQSPVTFNGALRLALTFSSTQTAAYDAYRECIPTGGAMNITTDSTYEFQWTTTGDCTRGLMHLALPHQRATVQGASVYLVTGMLLNSTTRGAMQGLLTRTSPPTWKMVESASIPISFYPKTRWTSSAAAGPNFLATLIADIDAAWSIPVDGSYYFSGKAAQKYASLCLIANDPAVVGSDVTVLQRCVAKLELTIAPFLDNSWVFKLKYDTVFGGIVSSQGFLQRDLNADFGNTVYNDHHFHYGYWVYTAAVLNFLHPTWSRNKELNNIAKLLLRDVATPNNADPYFPKFRSFDWFRGHSYSHGATTFADGKDEESSSEDMNFSYALYLYGVATKDTRMTAIGKLMTRLNARAIQTYFLMESTNTVHPPSFLPRKVPGILFDNKADYATWFSAEKYCIHGIQMIPVTPITEFVRTKTFITEEWDTILSKELIVTTTDVTNPWLSLLFANYARIDRASAVQVLQTCQLDDGLSRSWALYMAAQLN
ncbi:hypothetical protein Gpo141_00008742 [Globisporangium polare]